MSHTLITEQTMYYVDGDTVTVTPAAETILRKAGWILATEADTVHRMLAAQDTPAYIPMEEEL